jgi:uncharacterized protein YpmB
MKPSQPHYRHARTSGMNTIILIVIVLVVFAAVWHAKNHYGEHGKKEVATSATQAEKPIKFIDTDRRF